MTDEHDALSEFEVMNAVAGLAKMARKLYSDLKEEGFSADEAFKLTRAYMHGASGGKMVD
jgi:hypothetical protein